MPGHKRRIRPFSDLYEIDITEIEGFDNLFHAEGILLEAQRRAAAAYGTDASFYLVNGSTAGILSAVSACVKGDGKILMARNCHKAAYHSVLLNRLKVSYLYPSVCWEYGMFGAVSVSQVEEALKKEPDIQAVLITSPTYDGVVSDIAGIAKVCHAKHVPLIVDEAHGAHFAFDPYFPDSAVTLGADLVINSLHKTLPSPTQTAILHLCGSLVDGERLKKYLSVYQTSSPSYVFMAAMDACIGMMAKNREVLFGPFVQRLEDLRRKFGNLNVLHLIDGTEAGLNACAFDRSKVLIGTPEGRGPELGSLLRDRYDLEPEMCADSYVTAIMTVGDSEEGFDRLQDAVLEIDSQWSKESRCSGKSDTQLTGETSGTGKISAQPEAVFTIYETELQEMETVVLETAAGRISGEFAYLYPPGIPFLVPGERITEELIRQLQYDQSLGLKIQGTVDFTGKKIQVIK